MTGGSFISRKDAKTQRRFYADRTLKFHRSQRALGLILNSPYGAELFASLRLCAKHFPSLNAQH